MIAARSDETGCFVNDQRPEEFSNGESRVLELAIRLLSDEDPVARAVLKPRIFVGRLPEDMPVEIPIPERFAVVGSLVRSETDPHDDPTVEVVLDARMPAEHVRDAYREQMSAAGWNEPERRGRRGGGFDFRPVGTTALFCRSERGPALFLSAHEEPSGDRYAPTDVRLRLIMDSRHSPCAPEPYYEPEFDRIILHLEPPLGSYQWPGGGGGGTGDAYSTATLQSELDAAAIGAHYVAQLEEGGWSLSDEGQGGPQAWSTWSFIDEDVQPWSGAFFALRLAGSPQRYFLFVHVIRTRDHHGSS